ncbi:glycerophosphoryl diester phosphodiesterase membrane domain-containing protein [Sphingomonas sp. PB2P12]|uniref:glycerophosphoryl diester phosphodiesterase membrane domain-containing protein n=1 Tax=Sphingomonas sandaracina TaxID=3096157 RepID=UPI002FC772F6
MVKMGTVWDRTIEVLNGRTGMIAPVALIGMVVPSVIRDSYAAFSTPGTMSFALIGSVLAIGTLISMLWSQLAIVAIATDPATNAASARRQAGARVLPALGITVLITLVAALLVLPPVVVLIQSGFDFAAAASGSVQMTAPSPGVAGFIGLYGLAYLLIAIWISARLVLLNPVILNERRGIGAMRRSVQLTKGLTWRIIGVLILFAIVMLISTWAAQAVTGIIFRLALGADGIATATFLSGIVATIVTTVFTALAAVFTAQLYVAVREKLPQE